MEKKIDMVRFADDIVIVAEREQDLQRVLSTMDRIMEEDFNIKINKEKTKIMVCSRNKADKTRIQLIKEVEEFT